MTVSAKWYGLGLSECFNKGLDWDTDVIRVALLTAGYTPDQDAHDYYDDVSNYEVTSSGTSYTIGGLQLSNTTRSYATSTNVVKLDADDVTWAGSTISARYAVVFVSASLTTQSLLLGYTDLGQTESAANGNFTITWNTNGILTVTAS